MDIRSHIQLPKCVLKNFADPANSRVWYLSIPEGHIRQSPAKKLGTRNAYYSNEIETCNNANDGFAPRGGREVL